VIGPLFGLLGLVFLPSWCAESLKRDALSTGRPVGALIRCAFLSPLATAAVLAALTGIAIAGAITGLLAGWLFIPVGTGLIVAVRTRGLGGFGVGSLGLIAGGLLAGLAGWVVAVVVSATGGSAPGPGASLVYVPLAVMVVPILTMPSSGSGCSSTRGSRQSERTSSPSRDERLRRGRSMCWAPLLIGVVFGFALMLLYFAVGGSDGGDATFALTLFTTIVAVPVGLGLGKRSDERVARLGDAILGAGLGGPIGVVLLFVAAVVGLIPG
jgi:hypothetical protein